VKALALGLLALTLSGCASAPVKQRAALGYSASVDALALFQTTEDKLYGVLPGLTEARHLAIVAGIQRAAAAQIRAGDALLAWDGTTPAPQTVSDVVAEAQALTNAVVIVVPKLQPASDQEQALAETLLKWLAAVENILRAAGVTVPAWVQ
jgi:hypothetical protein